MKMTDKAILEIDGKKFEFPVITGTENERAIDIKTLRGVTNGVTIKLKKIDMETKNI